MKSTKDIKTTGYLPRYMSQSISCPPLSPPWCLAVFNGPNSRVSPSKCISSCAHQLQSEYILHAIQFRPRRIGFSHNGSPVHPVISDAKLFLGWSLEGRRARPRKVARHHGARPNPTVSQETLGVDARGVRHMTFESSWIYKTDKKQEYRPT